MSNGAATILGTAIIIAAVLHGFLGMYQITATETDAGAVAFRMDRLTGEVKIIMAPVPAPAK
jgi:hypothetical protein